MDGIVTGMVSNPILEVMMGLSSKSHDHLASALATMRKILVHGSDGNGGNGRILIDYVLASPKCVELRNAIDAGPKARTAVATLLLLAEMFRHPAGMNKKKSSNEGDEDDCGKQLLAIQLRLDKFAHWIVQAKLSDMYSHLSSGQRSRENGALALLSSIVSRGKLLAKQVVAKFDFSLDALKELARHPQKPKKGGPTFSLAPKAGGLDLKLPTRIFFIDFALSFLLVGEPGFLRWILQKRLLYAGVLHGLAGDDDETIDRVLSVLQRRVLDPSAAIPQGIKVSLFGDASLKQLQKVTAARERSSEVVQLAQRVLLEVCTDPRHGICPSGSSTWDELQKSSGQFGGGAGRLLRLMLKLKASEVDSHRELLLSISTARPLLAAAYIDSFPYSLEPRTSKSWFSAMSLLSSLVRIASAETPSFEKYSGSSPPSPESPLIQSCLRRVLTQSFPRPLSSIALLHDDTLVKHACLRLLLEVLSAIEMLLKSIQETCSKVSNGAAAGEWIKLETYIQDKARMFLPDGQTLVLVSRIKKGDAAGSKRKGGGDSQQSNGKKRLKSSSGDAVEPVEIEEPSSTTLQEIWEQDELLPDAEAEADKPTSLLQAKLLDVFRAYLTAIPLALRDINFDPLKFVPGDAKTLSLSQQESLISLLLSARASAALGDSLYTSVKVLVRLVVSLKADELRQKAHALVTEAMLSTGAFEGNEYETAVWLHNLPGWPNGVLDETVTSFLCDLVQSVGRNLYKYMDQLHSLLKHGTGDEFGPLVVCSLDSFLRLARPEAKSLKIPQKAAISVYLANVLHSLLLSQLYPRSLALVVTSMLGSNCSSTNACEWTALKHLYLHSRAAATLEGEMFSWKNQPSPSTSRLKSILDACLEETDSAPDTAKACALGRTLHCVHPAELLENFHQLLDVCNATFRGDFSVLISILGAYPEVLSDAAAGMFSEAADTMDVDRYQIPLGGALLRQCSFSVLFRAAASCCNDHPKLLTAPEMEAVLMEAATHLTDADLIVSIRMVLRCINDELARESTQLEAYFRLLNALVKVSGRLCPGDLEQLAKDIFSHPVINTHFLSKETTQPILLVPAGFDELSGLHPLNRGVLSMLELFLAQSGAENKPCDDYLQTLAERHIFVDEVQDGPPASGSLILVYTLAPYLKRDVLVRVVDAVLGRVVSDTMTRKGSTTPPGSLLTMVFHLAMTCFEKFRGATDAEIHGSGVAKVFGAVVKITTGSSLAIADTCLSVAVRALQPTKLLMAMVPVEILHRSMENVNTERAEVAAHLVRENPAMLLEFGRRVAASLLSKGDLLLLLPAARHFLENYKSCGAGSGDLADGVSRVYVDLLANCFADWNAAASPWDAYNDPYEQSMYANSVRVLELAIRIRPLQQQEKCDMHRSLLHKRTGLFDAAVEEPSSFSSAGLPSLVNRLVAKAALAKILLLDDDEAPSGEVANFISTAEATLAAIYKQLSHVQEEDGGSGIEFLEEHLLSTWCNAVDRLLSANPKDAYKSIKKMAKTLLRFRFGKVDAMQSLREVFLKLLERFDVVHAAKIQKLVTDVTDFVTGHSQFVPALLEKPEENSSTSKSTILTEVTSVLSLLQDRGSRDKVQVSIPQEARFHIVRLLRVLYAFRVRHREHFAAGDDASRETSKELESLLLAAYGASLRSVDREIFSLMHEIESAEGDGFSGMYEMDYLWGDAALQRRRDKAEAGGEDIVRESLEEIRNRRFKEDLALNPRLCGITALHFPMERELWTSESTAWGFDDAVSQGENAEGYDPAFILPFAMHALSEGCIDPEEFVRFGFLAIAFASTSSSCEAMRKYGYELLAAFSTLLEERESFKGRSQITTLLNFVKNAISEPWQKIPFVVSLFAAEASCALMHPENPMYVVINRFVLRSPSIDLQVIPLFQTMFTSEGVDSRIERAWIMKLLIAGLGSFEDALIYRQQYIAEILMSFCTSAMADKFSQQSTLKVLARAFAIPSFAKSLLENTGVLSWLASLAINSLNSPDSSSDHEVPRLSLQAIELLLSSAGSEALLLGTGTEELSKVASMLLDLPSSGTPTPKQWEVCSRPLFRIVTMALKLSQRRNKYRSSFHLSWQRLHTIVQAVESSDKQTRLCALECLLHCPPPPASNAKEQEVFCSIARLAASELRENESLAVVLLRWCSASLILGAVPEDDRRRGFATWWAFFTYLKNSNPRHLASETLLPKMLLSVNHGEAGITSLVNAVLLLSGTSINVNDVDQNLISGEALEVHLKQLPCPDELNVSWRWGFYKGWISRDLEPRERESYGSLLTLLQRSCTFKELL